MAKAIRFYGKLIKNAHGPYAVDTQDGRYEFDRGDVVDVKPYNTQMDEILIAENASITIKTTVAKIIKGKREVYGTPAPRAQTDAVHIRPGLMFNGSHEWRG